MVWIYNRNAFPCKNGGQMHIGSAGCSGLPCPPVPTCALFFLPCFLSFLSICISVTFVFQWQLCWFLPGHTCSFHHSPIYYSLKPWWSVPAIQIQITLSIPPKGSLFSADPQNLLTQLTVLKQ